MEVLAGLIIGIIVTLAFLKKPITININKTNEEIKPIIPASTMAEALENTDAKEDKVYEEDMKGLLDEVNSMMLGGGSNAKK